MFVENYMHHGVHSCRVGDTLAKAAETMRDGHCGFLVVLDDEGKIVSVLTDRDVCMAAEASTKSSRRTPIPPPYQAIITVRPSDAIAHAEELMRHHHLRRLPVTDPDGRPVGVLSITDLARAAFPGWSAEVGGVTPLSVLGLLAIIDRSRPHV